MSSPDKYCLVITREAQADMQAIAHYTALQWGETQAVSYLGNLYQTITHIGADPEIGRSRYNVPVVLKGRKSGRHVVFYRVSKKTIYIMRILHESMDYGRRLQ